MNRARLFTLQPRYWGSYVAMAYGIGMVVAGHLRDALVTTPVGELILYGAFLYHARKRQRFESPRIWPALEVYAGLSMIWMIFNILKIGIWQWHPLAFGLVPLLVVGAYSAALLGKPRAEKEACPPPATAWGLRQFPTRVGVTVLWAFLHLYALPKLGVMT